MPLPLLVQKPVNHLRAGEGGVVPHPLISRRKIVHGFEYVSKTFTLSQEGLFSSMNFRWAAAVW